MFKRQATWGHGPLVFNSERNTDASVNSTSSDVFDLLQVHRLPGYRSQRDAFHLAQGGTPGRILKGLMAVQLSGNIRAQAASGATDIQMSQLAALTDKKALLRSAFDPGLCDTDSPSTFGVYTFDWFEPTLVAGYSGWIPQRVWGRPESGVEITERTDDQAGCAFGVTLVCYDPRVYEPTEVNRILSPATTSGTLTNAGNAPGPLCAVITMAGAGSAAFTITQGTQTFVLNLSAASAGDVVVVVFENCAPYGNRRISCFGVEHYETKVSPLTPNWMSAPVGTNTYSISNTTNVTSCTLGTYSARS